MGEDGAPDSAKIDPTQQEPVKKIIDQNGIEIEKIYNPSVGTYDVMVTTGPSYMTKRQEALESMGQLLQGNPQLWSVAGDLFIKNMDWPGAQEMAKRFAKTIDPKLMDDGNKDPALQAAEQQMQAMGQEMEQMHQMLQNVSKSMEMKDIEIKENANLIKAFDAETKRIAAVQASMSPEQIQDIVLGTVHSMITSGDLVDAMENRGGNQVNDDIIPENVPQGMINEQPAFNTDQNAPPV
jgi:AAA15 family ATPase/GTPase